LPSDRGTSAKAFSLLVKPASADCNLRCDYCFYLEKAVLYPGSSRHRMTEDTLERLIQSYMATRQRVYAFGWQGGEPTLMGGDFFKRVTELQERYGRPGSRVSNGLQTNGTLITPSFARHLAEYRVLTGISIDGPEELHNRYRKRTDGSGSYRDVIRGLEVLLSGGAEVNALVLVSRANVDKPETVYRHLKELGLAYHQYIPCVETDGAGSLLPYAVTGEEWGKFLLGIFQEWRRWDMYTVSIRNFDALLQKLVHNQTAMCTMGKNCGDYFVVEHNGDVYPCDFFVEPELLVGNIHRNSWDEMRTSKVYRRFARMKCEWDAECADCEYLEFCGGDCPKHRPETGVSRLCPGIKNFYHSTLETFKKIANNIAS
jgi:uncharacterized protein